MPTQIMESVLAKNTYCRHCHQPLAEYRRKSDSGMMYHCSIKVCKNKHCEDYLNLAGTGWHETTVDWKPDKVDVKMATAMLNIVPQEKRKNN